MYHIYVDAFAGAGEHISKKTGKPVPGSPLNALAVDPPFREYHFIDLDARKATKLRLLVGDRKDVHVHTGDCNQILMGRVFPQVKYEDYRRGFCLLDLYGLRLQWEVIATAGQMKSFDIFRNFPIADINRNVIWRNPDKVSPDDVGDQGPVDAPAVLVAPVVVDDEEVRQGPVDEVEADVAAPLVGHAVEPEVSVVEVRRLVSLVQEVKLDAVSDPLIEIDLNGHGFNATVRIN